LLECFREYTRPEFLSNENAWYNESTSSYENVLKRLSFFNLPPILVVTLNRMDATGGKRNQLVDCPLDGLDLTEFVSGYHSPPFYLYDLYGIVYHHGNMQGGHYTASVRHVGDDEREEDVEDNDDRNISIAPEAESHPHWVHYNDHLTHTVLPEHFPTLINSDVYCLFYRRRK
jgi:ubiquitin C-terminal hydrolase